MLWLPTCTKKQKIGAINEQEGLRIKKNQPKKTGIYSINTV